MCSGFFYAMLNVLKIELNSCKSIYMLMVNSIFIIAVQKEFLGQKSVQNSSIFLNSLHDFVAL